jgi:hypothetical protein
VEEKYSNLLAGRETLQTTTKYLKNYFISTGLKILNQLFEKVASPRGGNV